MIRESQRLYLPGLLKCQSGKRDIPDPVWQEEEGMKFSHCPAWVEGRTGSLYSTVTWLSHDWSLSGPKSLYCFVSWVKTPVAEEEKLQVNEWGQTIVQERPGFVFCLELTGLTLAPGWLAAEGRTTNWDSLRSWHPLLTQSPLWVVLGASSVWIWIHGYTLESFQLTQAPLPCVPCPFGAKHFGNRGVEMNQSRRQQRDTEGKSSVLSSIPSSTIVGI